MNNKDTTSKIMDLVIEIKVLSKKIISGSPSNEALEALTNLYAAQHELEDGIYKIHKGAIDNARQD